MISIGPQGYGVVCRGVGTRYINKFVPTCYAHAQVGGYMRYVFPDGAKLDYNAYKKNAE